MRGESNYCHREGEFDFMFVDWFIRLTPPARGESNYCHQSEFDFWSSIVLFDLLRPQGGLVTTVTVKVGSNLCLSVGHQLTLPAVSLSGFRFD